MFDDPTVVEVHLIGPPGPQGPDGVAGDIAFNTYADAQAYNPATPPDMFNIRGQIAAGDYGASPFAKEDAEPTGLNNNLAYDPDFNQASGQGYYGDRIPGQTVWVAGAGWTIADGKATHTPGSTATLSQGQGAYGIETSPPHYRLADNAPYRIMTYVLGRTAGTVTPRLTGGSGTVTGAPISVSGLNVQDLTTGTDNDAIEFVPSTDFNGSITSVRLHMIQALPARAKMQLTLADGVTKPWYRRKPDEIKLRMCCSSAIDFANPADAVATHAAIREAVAWARWTGAPVQFGPGIHYVYQGANDLLTCPIVTSNQYGQVGSLTVRGVGLATVVKNISPEWGAFISLGEGENIDISDLVFDGNALECTPAGGTGGSGILLTSAGILRRVRMRNLWIKNVVGYGIGMQNNDVIDALFENITFTNVGDDGIDIKSYRPDGGSTMRKDAIRLNNIFVDGFGKAISSTELGGKAGVDIRGHVLASNIYVNMPSGEAGQTGIRFNCNAYSDHGRIGSRKSQLSNAYILGVDSSYNDSTKTRTALVNLANSNIGLGIYSNQVNASNVMIEGCGLGMEVNAAGAGDSTPGSIGLANLTVLGARTTDGGGVGLRFSGDLGIDSISVEAIAEGCDLGLSGRAGDNAFSANMCGEIILRENTLGHNLTVQQLQPNHLEIYYNGNTHANNLAFSGQYISANLRMIAPVTPTLTLMEDGNTAAYTTLTDSAAGVGGLIKVDTFGAATLDLGAIPLVDNNAVVRLFRNTDVGTGTASLNVLKADASAVVNHRLAGNDYSYLCADNSNMFIGGPAQASEKLVVAGNIKAVFGFVFPDYLATQIADVGHPVNTALKVAGKAVWDSTNHRIMVAVGSTAIHAWVAADGATVVNPI